MRCGFVVLVVDVVRWCCSWSWRFWLWLNELVVGRRPCVLPVCSWCAASLIGVRGIW